MIHIFHINFRTEKFLKYFVQKNFFVCLFFKEKIRCMRRVQQKDRIITLKRRKQVGLFPDRSTHPSHVDLSLE